MNDEFSGIPFMGTNYDYQVSLGVVMGQDSLSWESHVYCKEWSDVEHLVYAWRDARDFPVFNIEPHYKRGEQ